MNILLTEFILSRNQWSISKWISQFDDYPTASTKIPTKHKAIIKTNYEETQLTEPIGNVYINIISIVTVSATNSVIVGEWI